MTTTMTIKASVSSFTPLFLTPSFSKLLPLSADDDSNDEAGGGVVKDIKKEPVDIKKESEQPPTKDPNPFKKESMEARNARVPGLQKNIADNLVKLIEAAEKDGLFLCRVS